MNTDGLRKRRWASTCGSASHCTCSTSARRVASDADDAEVLDRLQRQAGARALEEPRRERIEALDPPVAVRRGQVCEAETRGRDLDVGARPGERRGELVVVPGRVRRRIRDHDSHGPVQ